MVVAEWHWPFGKEGDLTLMKTLMTMMLGLALAAGTASVSFAQDTPPPKKAAKAKASKGTCKDKSKPGKSGKCADGSDPVPAASKAKAKS